MLTNHGRSGFLGLALVTVAVLVANAWVAAHRLEGYAFRLVSYPTAYYPVETPVISGFEQRAARLEIGFNDGRTQVVELREGLHSYDIGPHAGASGTFDASYTPGRPAKFFSSSLLVGSFPQYPLAELAASPSAYPDTDLRNAREILASAGALEAESTRELATRVWTVLHRDLFAHMGTPPSDLIDRPAMEQYRLAVNGDVKIHCSNSAEIFALFGAAAGLPVRVVDVNRVVDGVKLTNHTFNEVYLREEGRWAYVDLNLGTLFVHDPAEAAPLNGVQLARLHESGRTRELFATRMGAGGLQDLPYDEAGRFTRRFLNPNVTFVFHRQYQRRRSLPAWLHRYAWDPELAYSMYGHNGRYWTKLALLFAAVGLALLWAIFATRWLFRPRIRVSAPD